MIARKKTVPLVFCFLTGKSENIYCLMLEKLVAFCLKESLILSPKTIFTDYEQAVINVSRRSFSDALNKG